MSGHNPYAAPNATPGAEPVTDDTWNLTRAAFDFVATFGMIRRLAAMSFGVAIFGLFIGVNVIPGEFIGVAKPVGFVVMFLGVGVGAALVRTSNATHALVKDPTWANVTLTLNRLTHVWTLGLLTVVLVMADKLAIRYFLPAPAATVVSADTSDATTDAAQRLRTVLRLFVGASIVLAVSNTTSIAFASTPAQQELFGAFFWPFVVFSAAFQGFFIWLVWRQAPLLGRFMASPSTETLRPVAKAHRVLWRALPLGVLGTAFFVLLGIVYTAAHMHR